MSKVPLPIDAHLGGIATGVAEAPIVIIKAAPGAGKTTRVPPALMDVVDGEILVLEPRRLAARLSAERISEEIGEKIGESVGFHIRFEQATSARTRIKFITEGLFLRYLMADPVLSGVGCVVLDEFHERHVHTDIALALTRWLQKTSRKNLKLVLMSATLDAEILSRHFPQARVFESEGRAYPVDIEYFQPSQRWNLCQSVAAAVEKVFLDSRCPGHVLAFLPGALDIKRTSEELASFAQRQNAALLELRAEIPVSDQRRVFSDLGCRKIILSTNVAETSVTIPGVTGVVDSGLAKIPGHASWSGLPTLDTKPISRSSCVQRAGRAGRTAPGVAIRVFEKSDFDGRPLSEKPEILRSDLTQTVLDLLFVSQHLGREGGALLREIDWLDSPPDNLMKSASSLLSLLGATVPGGTLSPLGERMAKLPLHPRLSRVLESARELNQAAHGALAVALLSEGMILRKGTEAPRIADSDITYQMELFEQVVNKKRLESRAAALAVDPAKTHRVEALAKNLCKVVGVGFQEALKPVHHNLISQALLAGFPDRVARVRRKPQQNNFSNPRNRVELNLCQGGGALLSPQSVAQQEEFILALDADESATHGNSATATQIHVAAGLSPDLLVSDPAGFLTERDECIWDEEAQRVRGYSRIFYGQIVVDETPLTGHSEQVEEVLFRALQQRWPKPFDSDEPLQFFKERCALVQNSGFAFHAPDLAGAEFQNFLRHLCENKKSFAEIMKRELEDTFADFLSREDFQLLEELAPREIKVGSGRKVKVRYDEGKPPWIASRLQDFFGTMVTPAIARGRVSLVVHLLAPSGQALQVTSDLKSFWTNAYPSLRKEYSRRYPRHYWPEDPKMAEPPPLGRNKPKA
jgi:ATP-dependent helicase HrpB